MNSGVLLPVAGDRRSMVPVSLRELSRA